MCKLSHDINVVKLFKNQLVGSFHSVKMSNLEEKTHMENEVDSENNEGKQRFNG